MVLGQTDLIKIIGLDLGKILIWSLHPIVN